MVALNLLQNYGQHHANVAGFREATGDFVITMDDDLQNPPEEALVLIDEAMYGWDVVFGRFERKQAAGYRRLGSHADQHDQPPGVRAAARPRRSPTSGSCAATWSTGSARSRTAHPYITGQALMYSSSRTDVPVRHEPRASGKSDYSLSRILRLVFAILFSYSSFPLRAAGARRLR